MSEFKVGDRVRILGNTKFTGIEGFIESVDKTDFNLTRYDISDNDHNVVARSISENIIELSDTKEQSMFEKVLGVQTEDEEYEIYMEGVRNHMIDAGIDPETNDPKDYIVFQEMAGRIPEDIKVYKKGKEILIVAVGGRENRGEAHFHVFRSQKDFNAWKNGACLMFTQNRYFDHKDNRERLSKDELTILNKYLKMKPDPKVSSDPTYWEYLVHLWNAGNYDWSIDPNLPRINYDYYTIARYKEK